MGRVRLLWRLLSLIAVGIHVNAVEIILMVFSSLVSKPDKVGIHRSWCKLSNTLLPPSTEVPI